MTNKKRIIIRELEKRLIKTIEDTRYFNNAIVMEKQECGCNYATSSFIKLLKREEKEAIKKRDKYERRLQSYKN
jgi:hypothetical protein